MRKSNFSDDWKQTIGNARNAKGFLLRKGLTNDALLSRVAGCLSGTPAARSRLPF